MSESPEEQPSTGVLGRIGSWFSPWRSKNPKSPSETSPTSEQAGKSEGEGESGESARPQARERQSEEEEQSSNPSLPCNILPCEEEDATQSAHRDSLSLCSPETAGGAPAGEEFAGSRKKRIGQGKEREESSNVISESGNPEKNASHLTHLSSSSEQGVVWDSAHTQPQAQERAQAQTGRRLRVYVEETSVFQGGQDTCAGQQVFQTKVTKSLEVPCKSSSSLDSPAVTSSTSEEKKRINVRHFVGTESNYSGFEGVSLKSSNNLQFESAKEQTEGDSMGRKNAARRKSRKNAQGDGGTSPHEKMPPKYEPVLEGIPTSDNSVTSPESKSPKILKGESSLNSSSKHSSTFQASPEQVQRKTSCPARVKQLDEFQGSNSVFAHSLECAVYGPTDMEGDDSLYRVERKTETPESKRRSLKISRSEVKLFTKNLHLKPKQTPEGENREVNAKDLTEDNKPKTETDSRPRDLKTINYERKPAAGRIADKISLFEGTAGEFNKQTLQTPRSADVSPVRKAKDRLKADFLLPEQRSRSADRYDKARSSSASPTRERLTTIRERMKNFTEQSGRQDRRAPPLKTAMRGMSQESSFTTSKSPGLNSQGKLDTKEQIQSNTVSESTLKPDGRDTAALEGKISISKDQPTDSKSTEPEDQGTKPNRIETKVPDNGSDVSVELTHSISQQSKGLSRPSSRSKRRKSREPSSPTSPNSENKPDHLTSKLVTAIEQEQADDIKEIHTPDEQTLPYTEEKTFKKQLKVLSFNEMDVSSTKENIDKPRSRQEPERLVSKDEPDTAASSSGTKTAIDKDLDISPQKEEKARGHSHLFTQEREQVSKDNRETEKLQPPPLEKQESPARQPKLDAGLIVQSEQKGKRKGREDNKSNTGQTKQHQRKETELMNQTESKDGEELDNVDRDKTNQTEKGKDTLQQLQPSDKMITVSDGGKFMSGPEGGVGRGDDRKNTEREEKTQPVIDKRKPQTSKPEPASKFSERTSSDLPPQTQHGRQTTTTLTQSFAVCAITQTNKEAPSGTKSDKEPLNRETATNLLTDLKPRESHGTESVVIRAETQPGSVFVEKNENTPDESCLHGANDAEFSSEKTFTAAEEPTVKATNDTPVPIAEPADSVSEKKSCVKKPPLVSAYKSVWQDDGEKTSAVKAVPSEAKTSGGIIKLAPIRPHSEASKDIESSNDTTSLKAAEKMEPGPDSTASDSTASVSTVKVGVKTDEKTLHSPMNEQSPVGNGEIFLHPDLHTVKKELVDNKPSQTPKAPTSPEAKKLIPDSIQGSSLKKSLKPRGLSKDDSITQQDVPSSWLDLDFPKQKLKVSMPKLSSSGSESNLLGTSGELDDDFVERIQNLCTPFSLPPRKHHPLRPPQPPFAMPAIKEDRFEKTFDPEEFMFGLSKKKKFTLDTTPSQLAKLQNSEAKSGLKPARASLANRSILLSSLDTHSRLKDMTLDKDEEDVKEEKDDQVKMKSRLEGSCVLSSLTSSSFKGKRNGLKVLAEGTDSGEVSPVEAPQQSPPPLSQPPQPPPPSPTAPAPVKDTLAKQSAAQSNREEAQATEAVVNDSGPPIPSFNDIKLPDYLEKYLPQKPAKPVQSKQEQEQVKTEAIGNMSPPACRDETDQGVKPGLVLPEAVSPSFPGSPPATRPTFPEFKKPRAQPQKRTPKGFHKRPGKMVLFEKSPFSGQAYEIYRDVADATSLRLSPLISVKVVRGCWVLYEKPDFQGRPIALEEGGIELTNVWAETGMETEPHNNPPMLIGSIRLAVWDYSIPRIDLFTEPEGHGRVTPYNDDTIETGSFGIPLSTASIQVYSGVWLLFSDPGFQGLLSVLETGTYPFPESWGFPSPFVGSLRPLKMGAFKVENPNEVKAVVYEKPGFEGSCLEIDNDVFSFCESEGRISADAANLDSKELKSVGSLKITGGLWVGFSEPGFEGQQHILEEGEYLDCSDWGGSEQLVSLRPILSDFLSPHLRMFSERDFGERGDNIALTVPVINMDDTGYGMKTQSIDVIGGIWVVFDEPGFCGEPCILEKGLYGCPEDWGALQPRVASAMSVVLDDFENAAKFKVQLFSEPGLQGSVLTLQDSLASLQDGFSVASCKVLAGNWLAFEEQDFAGRMYVLEEGSYADLRAMGAHSSSSILSLQTVDLEFSLPSIALFERRGLRGKRVILTDGTVNPQLAGGCSRVQSVLVEGGIWVLYEGLNYRGAQILLKPGEVPDWQKRSSWLKIGSLRPLLQKQVHFRLRNRQTGLMMSVTGDLDDVKLLRIQETEETGGLEQIWSYQNGHLHCKLLEDCCLCPSGSVTMAGSRVGLTPEPDNQVHLWSITPEGFIRYTPTPDLVLDVKGGHHFDKTQVILTTFDPKKAQQQWSVEVI